MVCFVTVDVDQIHPSVPLTRHPRCISSLNSPVHRMRTRYRELLLAEIAQTVADESEVEDELGALMNAVRG